ncbi:MAG: acyl carrier protein [Bacilli bacterium]|nr:acyl carrier protein [Bacilli bacterium]
MNEEEFLTSIRKILANCLDNEGADYSNLAMDTDIFEEYHITSIGALYLALELESAFSISLLNKDTDKIKTPRDIEKLIKSKQ